jgi:hypothetical protein
MQTSVFGIFDLELDLVHVHIGVLCSMYKSAMYVALSYIVHSTLNYISNIYLWGTWSFYNLNSTVLKFHSLDGLDRIVQTCWQVVIHMTTCKTLPFARLRAFQNQTKYYNSRDLSLAGMSTGKQLPTLWRSIVASFPWSKSLTGA